MSEGNKKQAADVVLDLLKKEYVAKFDDPIEGQPDAKGIHVETLLSNLGALAGFGCQMGIRESLILRGSLTEEKAFMVVETKNNIKFFFGDLTNELLIEGKMSVYSLICGGAQRAGAKVFPDVHEIAGYYARAVGLPEYFMSRLPKQHQPRMYPITALGYWFTTREFQVIWRVEPLHWGWNCALAAQKLIIEAKNVIDPVVAAQIVMEAAIPMSKVDPDRVSGAYYGAKKSA